MILPAVVFTVNRVVMGDVKLIGYIFSIISTESAGPTRKHSLVRCLPQDVVACARTISACQIGYEYTTVARERGASAACDDSSGQQARGRLIEKTLRFQFAVFRRQSPGFANRLNDEVIDTLDESFQSSTSFLPRHSHKMCTLQGKPSS